MKKVITRTVLLLGIVSLFNDISSELLYPVMPLFLQSIGFTTTMIGLLEGVAEAIAGLSKIYFGSASDAIGKRMPFVRFGYLMSSLAKFIPYFTQHVPWIFLSRTGDRLGKGVRTSARDALLSDESEREHKGTVFGFHRAMDTAGAALGPLMALIYLQFHPHDYKTLFLIAFFPAIVSVAFTFLIKEKKQKQEPASAGSFISKFLYWNKSPVEFRRLMIGLLFFGLMNSSDVFLLLRAKQVSGNDSMVLWAYILYNIVYALFAFPLGKMADKIGMKKMIVIGLLIFSVVYAGMAAAGSTLIIFSLLFLYGIYAAATEGVSKALITNTAGKEYTASAIGFYTGWNSIAALLASSAAGWIWYQWSPQTMFILSAGGTLVAAIYLWQLRIGDQPYNST